MKHALVLSLSLSFLACERGGVPEPQPVATEQPAAVEPEEGSSAEVEPDTEAAPAAEPAPAPEPEPEPEPEVDPMDAVREAVAGRGALPEAARELFWGSVEDDAPEVLNATRPDLEGRHYLYCDELNLQLWYERVRDLGGGYAGVGSDQAYTFIGWQRPQLVWLTDYDPWIRALHRIYHAFFEDAAELQGFRDRWEEENQADARAFLEARFEGDPDLELILLVFHEARFKVWRRLHRIRRMARAHDVPTFVSDEETYAFVRETVMQGRVRYMVANLLDDEALRAIGEVQRTLEVPLRVLYLSNAEDYWAYPDTFRENMRALHFDDSSVILRTNAAKRRNGDYRYNAQSATNFVAWLDQPYVERISDIWVRKWITEEDDIPSTFIDEAPFER